MGYNSNAVAYASLVASLVNRHFGLQLFLLLIKVTLLLCFMFNAAFTTIALSQAPRDPKSTIDFERIAAALRHFKHTGLNITASTRSDVVIISNQVWLSVLPTGQRQKLLQEGFDF